MPIVQSASNNLRERSPFDAQVLEPSASKILRKKPTTATAHQRCHSTQRCQDATPKSPHRRNSFSHQRAPQFATSWRSGITRNKATQSGSDAWSDAERHKKKGDRRAPRRGCESFVEHVFNVLDFSILRHVGNVPHAIDSQARRDGPGQRLWQKVESAALWPEAAICHRTEMILVAGRSLVWKEPSPLAFKSILPESTLVCQHNIGRCG